MPSIMTFADLHNPNSLSNRLRTRRFRIFESLVSTVPRPMRILRRRRYKLVLGATRLGGSRRRANYYVEPFSAR
jgi:hypothetical protein